jgi:hypothetical protein
MPETALQLTELGCLVKARWLASAICFSSRIEHGITRGSGSPVANQDGLAAACSAMTAEGSWSRQHRPLIARCVPSAAS